MEEITEETAKEIVTVLMNSEISLMLKIPHKLFDVLVQKAENCKKEISLKPNTGLGEQPISTDAKAILALIYKDILSSDDEKQKMNEVFYKKYKKQDLFKEQSFEVEPKPEQENTSLVVIQKWYEKVIAFFARKCRWNKKNKYDSWRD